MCVDEVQRRRLEAREGHIERNAAELGVRHGIFVFVAGLRRLVERRAAGIRHPDHAGDLIKAFPCRVVTRGAEDMEFRVVLHVDDQRMPAGDDEAQKRRFQIRVRQIVGRDMPADMVHRDERHAEAVGRGLGKVDADEHRADQPRRVGDGDGVDVLPGQVRLVKRRIRQGVDGLDVLARGKLGHDAAVEPVQGDLRRDAVGQDGSSVLHDGDGSLVAGGFHGEDLHSSSFLRMRASSFGCW